jgi:uncharacterized protein (TIGR03437 family)
VPLSRKLAGVEAVFDGIALPLVSVSPEEVQALLPRDFDSRGGASLYLRSERAGTVTITNAIGVRVAEASPGLFALGGKEPRSGLLLHPSAGAAVGAPPVTAENPAHAGEVLTVWATGLGAVFESGAVITPVVAQVDGQTVSVISAKLAEHSAGVYEIRIAVPAGWTGRGTAHFTVAQSGVSSNTITFPISSRR